MKIYLVGGAIRDALLNLPVKDKDWVVVGGTKKILLEKKFQQVGKDFPVFLHPETHEEYALARKERKSGRGYTGFDTEYHSNVTLEEDLVRRDLTMNAIAQDEYGNYIDPFHGQKDIKCRLIRHVSESFIEDPLRVLRTARFAATLVHLGFTIAEETMILMKTIVKKKELSYLTTNRIWNETEKAFKTHNPHVYFQVLYQCSALHFFFPKMFFLYEKNFFFDYRLLKKFYDHNIIFMKLAKISIQYKDIDIRFSYLCQCILVNNIYKNFSKIFFDISSSSIINNLCKNFQIPSYIREIAVLNVGFYYFLNTIYYQSSENIIKLLLKVDAWRKPERIEKIAILINFDFLNKLEIQYFDILPGNFLKKCFSIVSNISVQSILKKGFQGYQIKKELMRLRIEKLELWRHKNINFILFKKK
ncbi:tRNA CCA-pyrophosphorylase [Buchnera aphidicola (Macrosiphoniella sanborni)]|uniref:CCA-adding enzyme n=1 Tax=Buchnera aphidicola (Macrosiphoniella sanborni) TaxID=1241865 RepID=A0A4D6YB08_9GAMM|nr:tRNA CCA-pyrophosphorylase [Buchnera aphidicola]QCI23631.1 tRNA CCA-pyrophosphorylase [Buchnera aphidicola (Macrosiphoniella sanborni)]